MLEAHVEVEVVEICQKLLSAYLDRRGPEGSEARKAAREGVIRDLKLPCGRAFAMGLPRYFFGELVRGRGRLDERDVQNLGAAIKRDRVAVRDFSLIALATVN